MTVKIGDWVRHQKWPCEVWQVSRVAEPMAYGGAGDDQQARIENLVPVHPPRDKKVRRVSRAELETWLLDNGGFVNAALLSRAFYCRFAQGHDGPWAPTIHKAIIAARAEKRRQEKRK